MKHIGDLVVTKDNLEQVKNIEKVTGWLDIQADGASLPALQTTGLAWRAAQIPEQIEVKP